jgi:hypothetical protein
MPPKDEVMDTRLESRLRWMIVCADADGAAPEDTESLSLAGGQATGERHVHRRNLWNWERCRSVGHADLRSQACRVA